VVTSLSGGRFVDCHESVIITHAFEASLGTPASTDRCPVLSCLSASGLHRRDFHQLQPARHVVLLALVAGQTLKTRATRSMTDTHTRHEASPSQQDNKKVGGDASSATRSTASLDGVSSLLEALRGRDEAAKRAAIERLYERLTPHARWKLGNKRDRADAMPESIVQSVIVREIVGGGLRGVNDDQHLEARLRRAINNKVIDRDRKLRPCALPVDADGRSHDPSGDGPGPATRIVEQEELLFAARRLLAMKDACMSAPMSATQRMFVELAIFEEMSLDEIAKRSTTSVSTVKVRLSEARKKIVPHLLQSLRAEVDGTTWAVIEMILVQRRTVERCCQTLGVDESRIRQIVGCVVYSRLRDSFGPEGLEVFERLLGNLKRA